MTTVDDQSVGQQIKQRRTNLDYSLRRMAAETGIHRDTLTKVEADDPTVDDFSVDRYLSALDRIERRLGVDNPDHVVNVIELPDGTRVTFTGTPLGVAEAATEFLRSRE